MNCDIKEQLKIIQLYSRFFSEEEGQQIGAPISPGELKFVLSLFAKDKSPGPDG